MDGGSPVVGKVEGMGGGDGVKTGSGMLKTICFPLKNI